MRRQRERHEEKAAWKNHRTSFRAGLIAIRIGRRATRPTAGGCRSETQGQPVWQVFLLGQEPNLVQSAVLDLPHSLLGHIENLAHLAQR